MLAQNHAARAHNARQKKHQAEPPDGVKIEDKGEGEQPARHTADGGGMGGDGPADIDEGAEHLYGEGGDDDAVDDMGHVGDEHQVVAEEIAENGDDVGHHTPLLRAELEGFPARVLAVGVEQERGHKDGAEVDDEQHRELVAQREHGQIAEHEQRDQSHHGQVVGREDHAHDPCGQ